MHYVEIIKDAMVATLVGFCGKKVYHKIQNWYYSKDDINIDDVKIQFIPQTSEEEMIIITHKNEKPELFKYYKTVE